MATILDVANYFLARMELSSGSSITPLKLQKLCYYAQAWSLVWDKKELFEDDFQAWAHGPANSEVYNTYKDFGWYSIPAPEEVDLGMFDQDQLETLDAVWEAYGMFDGKYLEELTHQEDPWINARKGYRPGERCNNIITKESIKEYFEGLYDSGN